MSKQEIEDIKYLKRDYITSYEWLREADEEVLYMEGVFPLPELQADDEFAIGEILGVIFDKLRDHKKVSLYEKFCLSYYLKFLKDGPQNDMISDADKEKGVPFYEDVVHPILTDLYICWNEWVKLNKDSSLAKIMTYKGMLIRIHREDNQKIYPLEFASFSSDISALTDFTEGAAYYDSSGPNKTMIVTSTNSHYEEGSDAFGIALDDFINYLTSIEFWDEYTVMPGKTDEKEVLYKIVLDGIIVGKIVSAPD